MNKTVERIIREGAMSESMAALVFTYDASIARNMLSARSLVRTAYRICIFYSALVQAYIIGNAIHQDCLISELPFCTRMIEVVKRNWRGDSSKSKKGNSRSVISFLLDCCECSSIMAADAAYIIKRFRDAYEKYTTESMRVLDELNEDDFIAMLKAFPLLSSADVDFESKSFVFKTANGESFEIASSPFVYFYDSVSNAIVQTRTNECLVFTGVSKEKNGQLLFSVTELQKSTSVVQQTKLVRRQVAQNESLQLICKTAEMDAEWYSVDEIKCDLTFLDHLTDVTRTALSRYWKESSKDGHSKTSKNIASKLRAMFYGTDIYDRIPESKVITLEKLDNVFYELYINCGAFKIMSGLLLDYPGHEFGDELFRIYMEVFEASGRIDSQKRKMYEAECRNNINSRLKKLSEIVRSGTSQYDNRERALKAEWRAFCVLKAAGIQAKNIFTDEEEILSINDYFGKIKNQKSTIQDDLNNVITMLIMLYDALLNSVLPDDEKAFGDRMRLTRDKLKDYTTQQLFDAFLDVVRNMNESPMVMKCLGRETVCNYNELESYFDAINATLDLPEVSSTCVPTRSKKIFFSYAHEDKDKVKRYYEHWSQMGYNIFFDEDTLNGGDKWRKRANAELDSEECVAVLVFMSRHAAVSEAVSYELEHAKMVAEKRYPYDVQKQDQFIIPINLEKEHVSDYIRRAVHSSDTKSEYALRIREVLSSEKVYYNYDEMDTVVETRVRNLLDPDDAGELVSEQYNAFEVAVANFYGFLKYGDDYDWTDGDMIDQYFQSNMYSVRNCIFPLIASVKETKIKRDNTTLVAYELMEEKGASDRAINYILSAQRLPPDDYYCIPNARTTGEDCSWMVEPLLIRHDLINISSQEE